jgi:hypothetical protein
MNYGETSSYMDVKVEADEDSHMFASKTCLLKYDYVVPGDEHQSGITRVMGTSARCTSPEFVVHSSTTQRDQRAKSEHYASDRMGCLAMYSAYQLYQKIVSFHYSGLTLNQCCIE